MVRVSKTVPYDLKKGNHRGWEMGNRSGNFCNSFMAESAVDGCNILFSRWLPFLHGADAGF
jgi:hypothetical protein